MTLQTKAVKSGPAFCNPTGLQPARLLCPWDSPGKNSGVDCYNLLQRMFPTQGLNPNLLHCRQILYHLNYREVLNLIPPSLGGQNDLCSLPRQTNITLIQVYAPTNNAEEAEVERFYEDLQDLSEPTKKDVLFIIGDWNAKVGSQEIPGITGKFGFGIQNEAGQRLTECCEENTLVIANTLFQQHKRKLHITRW